jgi:hypothetical protein
VAYFMNELRPVFYSGRQLAEITNVPVLAIVGMIWIERHMTQQRRALWGYSAATVALVLVAVITLLIQSPTSHSIHRLLACASSNERAAPSAGGALVVSRFAFPHCRKSCAPSAAARDYAWRQSANTGS